MRLGTPVYEPDQVRVVRYWKGEEYRVMRARRSYSWIKTRIREMHGDAAANSATDWGWQPR